MDHGISGRIRRIDPHIWPVLFTSLSNIATPLVFWFTLGKSREKQPQPNRTTAVTEIKKCRLCGNTDLITVLSLGNQVLTGVFPRFKEETPTSGPLKLVKCHGEGACSLLQLAHSYKPTDLYGAGYGYRSGLNGSMVNHLRQKVQRLLKKHALSQGDIVLDIGSNDGTLLSFYPEFITLVGMDPTATKFREFYQPRVVVIEDFFSAEKFLAETGGKKASIVTSIAMLYDLENPLDFVRQIAFILEKDGIWHFEQSYMPSMIQLNAYDTVCHEHLEYFGLRQIQWMLKRGGLKILDVEINDINGGSFAVTAALESSQLAAKELKINKICEDESIFEHLRPYEQFAKRVSTHRDELCEKISSILRSGASMLGYGASTKGNVILQYCGLTSREIPAIAEVNPDKFGAFTPGSLIPIISEMQAHARRPDYFLVLPWHFRSNLLERESGYLRNGGKMLFPLPYIDTVGK